MAIRRDPLDRDRWARLRFAIIGPLLAAPPEPGALRAALQGLADTTWQHPSTGLPVQFGLSTIERWLYAARRASLDPVAALKTRVRCDTGNPRVLSQAVIEVLSAQYRDHPRWSCQLHFDNRRRPAQRASCCPRTRRSAATSMRRAWCVSAQRAGACGRNRARAPAPGARVRSYEVDHVGALFHLDFHHGSRKVLTRSGAWVTPLALGVLDDRSRLPAMSSGTPTRPPRAWCTD
jgi:hypothetical protein